MLKQIDENIYNAEMNEYDLFIYQYFLRIIDYQIIILMLMRTLNVLNVKIVCVHIDLVFSNNLITLCYHKNNFLKKYLKISKFRKHNIFNYFE